MPNNITPFAFVLAVNNLDDTAGYFRDTLGFTLEWPGTNGWQLAVRGAVKVMLGHCPQALAPASLGDHSYFGYLHVDDVDALYAEFVQRDAIILQPPASRPHGMREFLVATPEGHKIMIGQVL